MNDHDITQNHEGMASSSEPSSAFHRAMTGVQTRCSDLAFAIKAHDFEGARNAASDAVTMWLTARSACRRLLARVKEASPFADAARRELEERYMRLLELFARAAETIAVPELRAALKELRGTLTSTNAQPLSGHHPDAAPPNQRKQRGRR